MWVERSVDASLAYATDDTFQMSLTSAGVTTGRFHQDIQNSSICIHIIYMSHVCSHN